MATTGRPQAAPAPLPKSFFRTPTARAIVALQEDSNKLQVELERVDQQLSELHARSPWPESKTPEYYEQKKLESIRDRLLIRMDDKNLKIKCLSVKQKTFRDWWVVLAMIAFFAAMAVHSFGFTWVGSLGSACLIAFLTVTLFRILDGCQRILNILVLNEARREAAEQNISIPAARENLEDVRSI
jgi:hypothetical protein